MKPDRQRPTAGDSGISSGQIVRNKRDVLKHDNPTHQGKNVRHVVIMKLIYNTILTTARHQMNYA